MKRKTLSENVLHNTLAVIGILQEGGSSQLAVVLQLPLKTSCCGNSLSYLFSLFLTVTLERVDNTWEENTVASSLFLL